MPVSSETDRPLAKAEPISDAERISGITDLGRGESFCSGAEKGRVRICERHRSADSKVSEEAGEDVPQVLELSFPCSPW